MTPSQQGSSVRPLIWFSALLTAAFALYACGLNIWYYSDDFQYLYDDPAGRILWFFAHKNLYHGFYRPVNSAVIAVVQVVFGRETWPIHVVNIVVHAVLAWLVYRFMTRARFAPAAALAGSAVMLLSQANGGAVLSNDTFSQISGTFFGCLTLWALYRGYYRDGVTASASVSRGDYLLALVMFVICLASKETSVSFLPMVGLFLLVKNLRGGDWMRGVARTALEGVPFLMLTVAYMGVRAAIGLSQPSAGGGTYGFHVGFNIVSNFAQFLAAAIVPTSSADVFVAVKERSIPMLAVTAAGALAFMVLVFAGLRRNGCGRLLTVIGALAVLGLFPAVLMNHVGELYLYNAMPFISVIVGAAIGALLDRERVAVGFRRAAAAMLVVLAGMHIWGIQSKSAQMVVNGDRARRLLAQLTPIVEHTDMRRVYLVSPPDPHIEYSVFLMNGFSVFKWGAHIVWQDAGRPGVNVEVVDPGVPISADTAAVALLLTLRGDSVVVMGGH